MFAIPVTARAEQHVRVDVMDPWIGRFGRLAGDLLSRCVIVVVLFFLMRRAWLKLLDAAEYGDATNMLAIPIWPFYGMIMLGAALYAMVLIIQLGDILRGKRGDHG
ncbi:hypothetical protein MACH17_24130 [Phaeobacter inhibens]|nr:hypothetical protein MACH17_24130 [Phaeobacter inhibens]